MEKKFEATEMGKVIITIDGAITAKSIGTVTIQKAKQAYELRAESGELVGSYLFADPYVTFPCTGTFKEPSSLKEEFEENGEFKIRFSEKADEATLDEYYVTLIGYDDCKAACDMLWNGNMVTFTKATA